jgi:hypothetical protein
MFGSKEQREAEERDIGQQQSSDDTAGEIHSSMNNMLSMKVQQHQQLQQHPNPAQLGGFTPTRYVCALTQD